MDREWTQFYLSISPSIRYAPEEIEKYLLRYAFSRRLYQNYEGGALLPEEVLMRRKEAFSDGVSGHERSLYQVLQEYCETKPSMAINTKHNVSKTPEQAYYRTVFERYYPGLGEVVPYFWMPKYVEATDASARTLSNYTS